LTDRFSPARINKIDKGRVYLVYRRWPSLARRGLDARFVPPKKEFRNVLLLGMGGSAAAGDIMAGWLRAKGMGEMAVCKGSIPYADLGSSFVIACSVSGQTQETIEMMKTAVGRGATLVSISTGGKLMRLSREMGIPHVKIPRSPAPRFVLPFLVFSCFSIVDRTLHLNAESEATKAVRELERISKSLDIETPIQMNRAKHLAETLIAKTPVIFGSQTTWGAAVRFKDALNENAKLHAVADQIPELFHNEVEAWEYPSADFVPIFLRHSLEGTSDRRRANTLVHLLSKRGHNPVEIWGKGPTGFAELLAMVYELDMAAYYLAIGLGRDPLPTLLIDELKRAKTLTG
jgi:glucose/mannose-6-phosphate isomerase